MVKDENIHIQIYDKLLELTAMTAEMKGNITTSIERCEERYRSLNEQGIDNERRIITIEEEHKKIKTLSKAAMWLFAAASAAIGTMVSVFK